MMKRSFILALSAILLITSVFLLSSCQKPEEPNPPPDFETLSILEDGIYNYKIVRSDLAQSKDAETIAATNLRKAIIELSENESIEITTDWDNKKDNADIKEILVGVTNRQASIDANKNLAANEYLIRVCDGGTKIVILGGSDNALDMAVNQFISQLIVKDTTSIQIRKDLDMLNTFDNSGKIIILQGNDDVNYIDKLQTALSSVASNVSVADFTTPAKDIFDVKKTSLVILAGADTVTGGLTNTIQSYLNAGGKLMTLGGPAFTNEVYDYNGEWMTKSEYLRTMVSTLDEDLTYSIFDTSSKNVLSKFTRSTNSTDHKVTKTIDDYGLEGSDAQLCVEVDALDSWEMICYDFKPTIEKANILGFSAKGASDTAGLYIEIRENDGTRWYSSVNLGTEWDFYTLSTSDFSFWEGSAARKNTKPQFNNLKAICFGFAQSGLPMAVGHHTFYLADPALYQYSSPNFTVGNVLAIDTLAPEYEMFPVTNAANIVTDKMQTFLTDRTYTIPASIISCSPGRQGTGYDKNRTNRFIPLLEITDKKGLHAGYAAWINLFSSTTSENGKMEGSMIACFSATSNDFYDAAGLAAIAETVAAMLHPVFLVEGGTDEYIYVASDTTEITVGAAYTDLTKNLSNGYQVTVSLLSGGKTIKEYTVNGKDCKISKNNVQSFKETYDLSAGYPDTAVTVLKNEKGEVIDRLEHKVQFWSPKPEADRKYISSQDGYFMRDGKLINFFGVNYMPTSGVSETIGYNFEHYVCAAAYDPDVIHNDLLRIKDIGMNAVSVFVHASAMDSNNMLDLITQCEELGIYVDLSIRSSTSDFLYFGKDDAEKLITKLHFQENDNIIAYDIAWEPRIGTYEDSSYIGRKGWDADWREWITAQYGTIAHAEELWGCKAPRDSSGNVIGVTDAMLDSTSTQYNKIVAAYRQFIDDMVAKIFNETFSYMKKFDPNHLYSFRMSMSGSAMTTGSMMPSGFCYDFQSLASTADVMEPEGYALNASSDESMLQVLFANTYSRFAAPGTPVVWKEYGRHVWNGSNFGDNSSMLDIQADYYAQVLEYCYKSYTSGMFCWYFAGGFRIGENSDYGILNPDGSDRPTTALLREYAPKFISQGERKAPDVVIVVDRDSSNRGIFALFDQTKSALRTAFNSGKFVAFTSKQQKNPGDIFYADTVLKEATGNTSVSGIYPFHYINGQIKGIEAYQEGGRTYARITVCNTDLATWRAGTVSLVSTDASAVKVDIKIDHDLGYLEETTVEVELKAKGKIALRFSIDAKMFGNTYSATIK